MYPSDNFPMSNVRSLDRERKGPEVAEKKPSLGKKLLQIFQRKNDRPQAVEAPAFKARPTDGMTPYQPIPQIPSNILDQALAENPYANIPDMTNNPYANIPDMSNNPYANLPNYTASVNAPANQPLPENPDGNFRDLVTPVDARANRPLPQPPVPNPHVPAENKSPGRVDVGGSAALPGAKRLDNKMDAVVREMQQRRPAPGMPKSEMKAPGPTDFKARNLAKPGNPQAQHKPDGKQHDGKAALLEELKARNHESQPMHAPKPGRDFMHKH